MINHNIITTQTVYIHLETTNKSFIDMHYFLERTGIKNNAFFLVLYDSGLAGVDPRDPALPLHMKQRVLRECCVNYWYFLREVVRIPKEGGPVGSGSRYLLNRANLAMNYLFTFNFNMFVEIPRQNGKTVGVVCRYVWIFNFGSSNSRIIFIHKDHKGSKDNLNTFKIIRDALPSYLQMSSTVGIDGKKLKIPNTKEELQHPLNGNKITTFASARSEEAADKLGRGCTVPLQFWDEFAFMLYNNTAYSAAAPAFKQAAENAALNHSPYGIVITTTPNDLSTKHGMVAYKMRNNATQWNEHYYDLSPKDLYDLHAANNKSSLFHVMYTYQQLGRTAEYFSDMVKLLEEDWSKIRREILLEWSQVADDCPFSSEDLDIIKEYCHDPIKTIFLGKYSQYQLQIYEDLDPRYPAIIGVDVAGAMYQDSSAITIIDSRTTKVCAVLNCNYIPQDDLADAIYVIIKQYLPNSICNCELNGGFGKGVIQRLVKTSVKRNLYFEIKEKVIEEAFNGYRVNKNKRLVREYGLNSTKDIRARLIEILYERVSYHKDKFIAPILHSEMSTMVIKKSGKCEHAEGQHDDSIFSYLMALYVWYDGKNIAENWGIQKNTIKTDEDVEIVDGEIDQQLDSESLDINDNVISYDVESPDVQMAIDFVKGASRYKTAEQYKIEAFEDDDKMLANMLNEDRVFRNAYNEKFHVDTDASLMQNSMMDIPDYAFMDMDDEEAQEYMYTKRFGNLRKSYDKINL